MLRVREISAQATKVRDSVGIHIVENTARLSAPVAFTLGAKPNVDIGGLDSDPDKELSTHNGYPRAIRLTDGRVAVIDRTRVQYFGKDGKRLRITGREGGGPGEFTNIVGLCRTHGDTVLASDGLDRRITVMSETGEYRTVLTLPVNNYAERDFCLNDGTFVSMQFIPTARGSDGMVRANHIDRTGSVTNVITDVNTGVFDPAIRRETQYLA